MDLESYMVLDNAPDENLDELARIAALACDTPISQITFVHSQFTFVKSNIGNESSQSIPGKVKRRNSFCQHTLNNGEELLVINDTHDDPRFTGNPYVVSDPYIRFYAGTPLNTPSGNVLGTLCVIDNKPRKLSRREQRVLKLLSKKAMEYLNTRRELLNQKKQIQSNESKLKFLTDNLPIGIFQLTRSNDGRLKFNYLNRFMAMLYPSIVTDKWFKSPEVGFSQIHLDDLDRVTNDLYKALENLSLLHTEYRVKSGNGYSWHVLKGNPEKMADGRVLLHGSIQNINDRIKYEEVIEQMAFDISHILRKPITNLMGLNSLIESESKLTKNMLVEYVGLVKNISLELEAYTRELNDIYEHKKEMITGTDASNSNNL